MDAQGWGDENVFGQQDLDRETRIALLEEAHDFPGMFKIVVIAHEGEAFHQLLQAKLAALQGDAPFTVRQRESRKGNYISYRVHVHVGDADTAIERKAELAQLEGVVTLL